MAVEPIRWETLDTTRLPSASIWGRYPLQAIREGSVNGVVLEDYFTSFNVTPATTEGNWGSGLDYAQAASAAGTIVPVAISAATTSGTGNGGITVASTNINEFVGIRTVATPFTCNRASGKFAFECRISKSSIANTVYDVYCGLYDNTSIAAGVPFSAAATLADHNLLGIWSKSTAGANAAFSYKSAGNSAVDISTTDATMVAATYTKLGFKFELTGDPAGTYYISTYQDGVRLASTKQVPTTTTDMPTSVGLGMMFAIRNAAGSSPGSVTLNWWRAAQLYYPMN